MNKDHLDQIMYDKLGNVHYLSGGTNMIGMKTGIFNLVEGVNRL